jgi:hypothetical protein
MTNVHHPNRFLNFLFKTAGNINHSYSPLKIFCRRSCHFFFFMGEKYSYHIRFVCAKRLGWWTLVITWKVLRPRPQLDWLLWNSCDVEIWKKLWPLHFTLKFSFWCNGHSIIFWIESSKGEPHCYFESFVMFIRNKSEFN